MLAIDVSCRLVVRGLESWTKGQSRELVVPLHGHDVGHGRLLGKVLVQTLLDLKSEPKGHEYLNQDQQVLSASMNRYYLL